MLKKRYKSAKQVDGVVDLERLNSGPATCIERKPEQFLDLTYPSVDLQSMLRALHERFDSADEGSPGLFLAEAVKGLGKSHALLTAYHLFMHPDQSKAWMNRHGYKWNPPADPVVIIKKFTDESLPFSSLWMVVAEALGGSWPKERQPDLKELRAALGNKHLVLIFDELERGITNIVDPARRSQNLSFLQMLCEEATRNCQITIFAAIYDGSIEPGTTLKRSPRVELRFRNPEDRAAIVRHRLFSDADTYDKAAADALIRSSINAWSRLGIQTPDDYETRLRKNFPFLPGLIELIFERISASGGFQGTRGALGLLAAMLDASPDAGILAAANCRLSDRACVNRLQDLDPAGNLITCAQRNLADLKSQPYAEEVASAVLFASLAPGLKGLTREELIRHVVVPGMDPNQFESTLQAFRTFGSFFHEKEARFCFDLEENEHAKVEIETQRLSDERAREEIKSIWKQDLFRENLQAVIFTDVDTTKAVLDQTSKAGLRFVLSPRRLSNPERHALYHGLELRNQVILLEPRDDAANHTANPDVLSSAKRHVAASGLVASAGTAERRSRYERIAQQERRNVRDFIKGVGLIYVRVEGYAERPEDSVFEQESLGQAADKQAVVDFLRTQIYPRPLLVEHLREHVEQLNGLTVAQVERSYKNTLGFPVPLMIPDVTEAVISLVENKDRILGLQHQRRNFCGERVDLGMGELPHAILAAPWPAAAAPPPPVHPPHTGTPMLPTPVPTPGTPTELPVATPAAEDRGTPACRSKNELRQEVAEKIKDLVGADIQRIRFQIFAQEGGASLTDYPAALRGMLTGNGDIEVQLDFSIPGPLDKAAVESLCESLPTIKNGMYTAKMRVTRSTPEPQAEEDEERS